jgi:aromatic-L-amino-acid decarboxylase
MDGDTFRRYGHEVVDWVADYMEQVGDYPVLPPVAPGEIRNQLPAAPPGRGESMDAILDDFRRIILPGITHWNHPRWFAYFPANNSGPSILAELISAGLGVNAMNWQTSPAATELEETVMDWLRQMIGLPEEFRGVIHDTASTATLCALICARERISDFAINRQGFYAWPTDRPLRFYASQEAHSSVEKGARLAGLGSDHLVKVPVDGSFAMDPDALEGLIAADLARGFSPCAILATVGTTSSTAVDPVPELAAVARRHGLWLHVDAALAGSAAILPEKRHLLEGCGEADSLVFNPHKWLFTNFDCSAFFVRRPEVLTAAMSILPEYLKTDQDRRVTNYRDWGIQLGRRFRALKLWFVIRHFGVEGLQAKLRDHIAWAGEFAGWVDASPDFERLAPVPVNTVCFRLNSGKGGSVTPSEEELDRRNKALMDAVNATGRIYLTHTRLGGRFCLRLCVGQTQTRREDVSLAWSLLKETAARQENSNRTSNIEH